MKVAQEEAFDPLAAVIVAENEMQGIKIANDSKFGPNVWAEPKEK